MKYNPNYLQDMSGAMLLPCWGGALLANSKSQASYEISDALRLSLASGATVSCCEVCRSSNFSSQLEYSIGSVGILAIRVYTSPTEQNRTEQYPALDQALLTPRNHLVARLEMQCG